VPESHWEQSGPGFTLLWGGRLWVLKLDESEPGLRCDGDGASAKLLSLSVLRAAGQFDFGAFSPSTLTGFELHRDRVEATFAPSDWGGLTVRAAWSPAGVDAVDLEVQASATSVGVLFGLEVEVASHWMELLGVPAAALAWQVEPRDRRSAASSYDGREPAGVLRGMTTLPVADLSRASCRPRLFAIPTTADPGLNYVEMVQPNDVARRIIVEPAGQLPSHRSSITRYALFGHDLEKGVVLRARLRGCWIRSQTPEDDARRLYDAFLQEPPPLGP
jgi:hypothetical protein